MRKIAKAYEKLGDWNFYPCQLDVEFTQCLEEGLDIEPHRFDLGFGTCRKDHETYSVTHNTANQIGQPCFLLLFYFFFQFMINGTQDIPLLREFFIITRRRQQKLQPYE